MMKHNEIERVMIGNDNVEWMTLQFENEGAIAGKFIGTMSIKNPYYCNPNADDSNFKSLIDLATESYKDVSIWAKGVCIAHIKKWYDEE